MPIERNKKKSEQLYVGILLHDYILEHHKIGSICSLVIVFVGMWIGECLRMILF
jgi:hypothetical protein